jgi:hypothetical protein
MTKALSFYDQYSRRAFAVLALVCAVSAFCYGAFLLEAVAHTAARARASHDLSTLRGKLGAVENHYLSAEHALTPELARSLGLAAPKTVSTVYATDAARTLTLAPQGLSLPHTR